MQIDLDVDLVGGQIRVARTPSRFRVDPRIDGRRRQEIELHGQVDNRFAVSVQYSGTSGRDPLAYFGADAPPHSRGRLIRTLMSGSQVKRT